MLAGRQGPALRWALDFQMRVGRFFGATRMVRVTSAHVAADVGLIGDAGLEFVEGLVARGAKVCVPAVTDPRSVDFERYREFKQPEAHVAKERRLVEALTRMGMLPCHTCINYQTVTPPRFGEHLAWGDTGSVIYGNSVAGARSNFEGGPAAVAAALTGRVPAYGFHLSEHRRATFVVDVRDHLTEWADWGALGCWIGRRVTSYWEVPALLIPDASPSVDDLKHLGAALASYGSMAMFHLVGVTPEAPTLEAATAGREPSQRLVVERGAITKIYESFRPGRTEIDLVVFTAPQLSLLEVQTIVERLGSREVAPSTQLILTVNHQVRAEADRFGYLAQIERAGGTVLTGVCFYLMTPEIMREIHGYRTILTNSAKLANIIAGSGYDAIFRRLDVCLDAAVRGRLVD